MDNKELLKTVEAKAQKWLGTQYDEQTRLEVKAVLDAEDKSPLIEAFYKDLEFGTGGLRGIMGAGSNREHIYCRSGDSGTGQLPERLLQGASPDKRRGRV